MPSYLYKHLFVDGSADDVLLLGYRLELTPAERKIVTLIAENGRIGTGGLCSALGGNITRGNVAVHICSINKKAAEISGRKLIGFGSRCYYFNEYM